MRYKSFKDLPSLKPKKKSRQRREPAPPRSRTRKPTEEELFEQAMNGVQPLPGDMQGRRVPAGRSPGPQRQSLDSDSRSRQRLLDVVNGRTEFEIELTSEFIHGHVKGLNHQTVTSLKQGKLSPEAHLDLHGYTLEGAENAVLEFVREHYLAGRRCVLIVTGRGRNSPLGRSLLRDELQNWLTREPLKRVVLAFSTATPRHGGAGAVYLLLRKFRKGRGKVVWQRFPLGKDF